MKIRFTQAFLMALILTIGIISLAIMSSVSFAFEKPFKTVQADAYEIKDSFTLILYGGRFVDDLETVAILDIEGDEYQFEPYAPDFDYKVKKGIKPKEALAEAEKFVSFHNAFWRSQLSKILDNKGNAIGYELRPLYLNFIYGGSDLLDIYYWPKEGGRIKVTIKLIPQILEKLRFPGGSDGGSGGGGN